MSLLNCGVSQLESELMLEYKVVQLTEGGVGEEVSQGLWRQWVVG
jgi:hypothetical protein